MTERPVNSTPKRRSPAEVSRLVEQYLEGGLSLKAFCRQHHLDHSRLARPGSPGQRQNAAGQSPQPSGRLRPELASEPDAVSVGAPSGVTLVVAGGRRIEPVRRSMLNRAGTSTTAVEHTPATRRLSGP